MSFSLRCASPDDTRALGRRLGAIARPGLAVALTGTLGAGKTVFAKGVGEGLGVAQPIASPTFVLLAVYDEGRLPLWHADLYRLQPGSSVDDLELDADQAAADPIGPDLGPEMCARSCRWPQRWLSWFRAEAPSVGERNRRPRNRTRQRLCPRLRR